MFLYLYSTPTCPLVVLLTAALFRSVLFRPDCFATYSHYMAYIEWAGPGFIGLGGAGLGEGEGLGSLWIGWLPSSLVLCFFLLCFCPTSSNGLAMVIQILVCSLEIHDSTLVFCRRHYRRNDSTPDTAVCSPPPPPSLLVNGFTAFADPQALSRCRHRR